MACANTCCRNRYTCMVHRYIHVHVCTCVIIIKIICEIASESDNSISSKPYHIESLCSNQTLDKAIWRRCSLDSFWLSLWVWKYNIGWCMPPGAIHRLGNSLTYIVIVFRYSTFTCNVFSLSTILCSWYVICTWYVYICTGEKTFNYYGFVACWMMCWKLSISWFTERWCTVPFQYWPVYLPQYSGDGDGSFSHSIS